MKRALIFDFGGVLMKTIDYSPRLQWDDALNLPAGSVERIVHNQDSWKAAQHGQIPIENYWKDVQSQLHLSDSQLAKLQAEFYAGDRLDEDLIAYIREKRASGVRIALLSNDSSELRAKLARLNILHLFDPLVISAEIGVMKPDARAYQAVLDRLHLPADLTVFIDDLLPNVEAASALGIHGIHYRADLDLRQRLEPLLET